MQSDTWDYGNYLTRFEEKIVECYNCDGTGEIPSSINGDMKTCYECEGTGELTITY